MISFAADTAERLPTKGRKPQRLCQGQVRDAGVGTQLLLSANRAGELLAGTLPGFILNLRGFAKRQLEAAQAITQRTRVMVADDGRGPCDQAGKCGDELARLVEVLQLCCRNIRRIFGQPAFDGGGRHQVYGCGSDDLDGGYFGDVTSDIGNRLGGYRIFRTHGTSLTYD